MNAKKALAGLAVAKKMRDLADYDMNDALALMGLRRRASASTRFFGALGLVLGGVAVGTVLGLMLAPRAGKDLRESLQSGGNMPGKSEGGYGARPMNVGAQGGSNFS
ncbi:hypothetical protein [Vulgatibacter sp.]|uniref:hypothetical protein n=1 Tax=Vulgatibacter sp. TaxID=1971226 RepID=UPI003567CCA1